jgi:hypothetical protein
MAAKGPNKGINNVSIGNQNPKAEPVLGRNIVA